MINLENYGIDEIVLVTLTLSLFEIVPVSLAYQMIERKLLWQTLSFNEELMKDWKIMEMIELSQHLNYCVINRNS